MPASGGLNGYSADDALNRAAYEGLRTLSRAWPKNEVVQILRKQSLKKEAPQPPEPLPAMEVVKSPGVPLIMSLRSTPNNEGSISIKGNTDEQRESTIFFNKLSEILFNNWLSSLSEVHEERNQRLVAIIKSIVMPSASVSRCSPEANEEEPDSSMPIVTPDSRCSSPRTDQDEAEELRLIEEAMTIDDDE